MKMKNRVQLIGNLGADPKVKKLDNGNLVVSMSLATNENVMRDGKRVKETQWHNLVCFNNLAQIASEYLSKGREILVVGKLVHRTYEKDGERRYYSEVVLDEILMLGGIGQAKAA